jgi:hypothetical protein
MHASNINETKYVVAEFKFHSRKFQIKIIIIRAAAVEVAIMKINEKKCLWKK